MDVKLYIKETEIDLFEDENIEINLNVKNVSDISKLFTEFSQSFSLPSTKNNNFVFQHWYNADINGGFNASIRVDAYLEINSLPFRYGTVQLENVKMKNGLPYSYSCTFYGAMVNLSDIFGEDELGSLDFETYNHLYSQETVINSMNSEFLNNGDLYYPLINAINEMSLETGNVRDLENLTNNISYREFKPALREIRIIEAIESKYGITFSRDFFDRAVFYNLFLWLHKDTGYMRTYGNEERIDLQGEGELADIEFSVDTVNDIVTFTPYESLPDGYIKRHTRLKVSPLVGYENITYKLRVYVNDVLAGETEGAGVRFIDWRPYVYNNPAVTVPNDIYFTISSQASMLYKSTLGGGKEEKHIGFPTTITTTSKSYFNATENNIDAYVNLSAQMPEMKIKDYFNSLVNKFNLVVIPVDGFNFYVDTLDAWYSKGKNYDINKYIDISEIQIKKPDVKKKIEFLYQKTEYILGKQYFDNNQIGYGDLKATYNISGSDMKIETGFENMLFERLQREASEELTELQAGYAIDKDLNPKKGKPIRFYRNGLEYASNTIYIQPFTPVNEVWHTATEDNKDISQVTNSLNWGSDVSSYFYTYTDRSLYFNWWKTYIEDLYNVKCRVLSFTCYLPPQILYKLKMNDRFIIQDKKYKISNIKANLINGKCSVEVFSDFSTPADSIDNETPLTVDSTLVTVDNDTITVDTTTVYTPVYSFIINGIDKDFYSATKGTEFFEVKVTANTSWSIAKVDSGDGVSWFDVNKPIGNKTDYVRVKINSNSGTTRGGILRFTIGSTDYDLNIIQE